MPRTRPSFRFVLAAALAIVATQAAATEVRQSGYSPLYLGVDTETATVTSDPAKPGGPATLSHADVVRIDTLAPGIAFTATEHRGPLDTIGETISQFATRKRVRLAINANFFAPCCTAAAEPKTVTGLLVSNGQVVEGPTSGPTQSMYSLAITRGRLATIGKAADLRLGLVDVAVSGSAMILSHGQDISAQSPEEGDPTHPNPRTLVGTSHHGRYLYLVAIDGRVTGYSTGTTNAQSAALMAAVGCEDALNLDGGGSTELVRADDIGHPFVVNNPSGGAERYDAAALGVYAWDLPFPRLH